MVGFLTAARVLNGATRRYFGGMNYLLFVAGLLLASGARAQATSPAPVTTQAVHYQYCLLTKNGNTWQLDYG